MDRSLRRNRFENALASAARLSARAILLLAGIGAVLVGVNAETLSEYQVKAAFIYNIAKFVDWPQGIDTKTARICIIGSDPFGDNMNALQGKPIDGRLISVTNLDSSADLKSCQILFVSSSESGNLDGILRTLSGSSVLTIGDTGGYAQRGVVVNFYLESQKVRFEINIDAAKRAKLNISSQLLKLARIVRDQGDIR